MKFIILLLVNLILVINFNLSAGTINSIFTILEPTGSSTKNQTILVSGRVETVPIEQLTITVEPYLETGGEKTKSVKVGVQNGFFSEKINLYSGLNLIKLSSPGGKHQITKLMFRVTSPAEEKFNPATWGTESDIVITAPRELKLTSPSAVVKGVVTETTLKTVDLVVMNTVNFLSTTRQSNQQLEFFTVPVTNLQFTATVRLTEGMNVLLVRPGGKPADPKKIQILSLVFEKVSLRVYLDEPVPEKNSIVISGTITNTEIKQVRVNLTALVEDEIKPNEIYPKSLYDRTVKVDKDGRFKCTVSLRGRGNVYTVKYSPTITVYAGKDSATKTLLKW